MEEMNLAGAVLKKGNVLREKYTVEYLIGTGGFGRTYRMRDNLLNIPVAVKELTNAAEKDKKQFLEEARIMARFSQNQGIVNVRDFFEANGTAYIVMEYLDGMDLGEHVKTQGIMSMDEALENLRPIMEALAIIHKEGFIHRDISPDNIRITSDGQMKLLDFGAARDVSEDGRTVTVLLKKGYTPEEQYRSREYQGPWTDVYAFCGVLYYCITGKVPVDCIQRLFHDDLRKPSELGACIDSRQEAALLKGLSLRADDRYGSMEELRRALFSQEERFGLKEENEHQENVSDAVFPRTSEEKDKDISADDIDDIWTRIEAQKAGQRRGREEKEAMQEETGQMDASKPPEKTRQPSEKKREKKRRAIILLSAVLSGIALAAAVLGLVLLWSVNPYQMPDNEIYSQISDKTVTEKDIKKIAKDRKCKTLSLLSCEVSDEIIEAIALLDNVQTLNLHYCSGFTDLTPLAGMKGMTELSVRGTDSDEQVLEGDVWFKEDFSRVTYLSLGGYVKMTGTDFLKHFPALESFYLPLEGCDNLEFFRYMDNMRRITIDTDLTGVDLSPIENCRHLESLTLADTNIDDLSMVSGMEELSSVDVTNCQISDITPLENCPVLRSLYMDENQIGDLSPLEGKEYLTTLCLNRNQVRDITPLAGLNLRRLELGENQIQDVSPLSGCGELTLLYLQENQIRDISALSGCRKIESLNLSGNQLENLSGCEAMISLTSFYASRNRITDITGIANSTSINYMDLSDNQIGDIHALDGGFTSLRGLNISDNLIRNIESLEKCIELRYLMADRNEISSLAALKNASQLNAVFADENRLIDLEGLQDKENLFAVTAYDNQVEDIQVLSACPNLLYLDFGKNQIRDITFFRGLASGKKGIVLLEHNQIQDFSLFPAGSGYYMLTLYDNPADDLSSVAKIKDISPYHDSFYLPYGKNTDYKALGELNLGEALHLVDTPLSEQASILKQTEESDINRVRGGISFDTGDEADKAMEGHRTKLREECNRELRMLEGDALIAGLAQ